MALGPIDYTLQVQQPFQAALQGYQAGSAIRQEQMQAEAQRLQAEQQQRQQQALQALLAKPNKTADDYAQATLLVPGMREHFKQSWEMHSAEQQRSSLDHISQVYAAAAGGQPEIARRLLADRAQAMENSGDTQRAQAARTIASMFEQNPTFALGQVKAMLTATPGGDKVIDNYAKLGAEQRASEQAPADLRAKVAGATKAEADAETAKVASRYADQTTVMELQKRGWDIKKVVADIEIAKEANRIRAIEAQTGRAANDLKRQELGLKVQEARAALDDKIRAKVADAESGAASIDNALNTIERFRSLAVDKDGRPSSTLRAAAGPIDSMLPTMQTDVADLEALAATLKSQFFLSQVPLLKGTGNLSDAEGKKLDESLANLSLKQSPEQLLANVNEAYRLANKARSNLSQRTGVPLRAPDTPAASRPPASSDYQGTPTTTKGGATVSSW